MARKYDELDEMIEQTDLSFDESELDPDDKLMKEIIFNRMMNL